MVGVAIRGGILEMTPLDEPEPASVEVIALVEDVAARLLDRPRRPHARHDPLRVDHLLLEVAAVAPHILRMLTEPMGDLLDRCGLATHRDLVGTPLTDWSWQDGDAAIWDLISRWNGRDDVSDDEPDPVTWSWADDTRTAMDVD